MDMVVPGDDSLRLVQDGFPFGLFGADEEKMDVRIFLFELPEGLDELVDALVPVQPAHEYEGEAVVGNVVIIPEVRRAAAQLFRPDVMAQVDAPYVAVAQDSERFPGDLEADEVVPDADALGNHMRGAGGGQAVRRHQQAAFPTLFIGEDEAGEGMDADGDAGPFGGHHRQEPGFRSDGMDHVGPFLPEDADELEEGFQVAEGGDFPRHGHGDGPDFLPLADAVQLRLRRGKGDDLVSGRQVPEKTAAEQVQRERDRSGAYDLLPVGHFLEAVDEDDAGARGGGGDGQLGARGGGNGDVGHRLGHQGVEDAVGPDAAHRDERRVADAPAADGVVAVAVGPDGRGGGHLVVVVGLDLLGDGRDAEGDFRSEDGVALERVALIELSGARDDVHQGRRSLAALAALEGVENGRDILLRDGIQLVILKDGVEVRVVIDGVIDVHPLGQDRGLPAVLREGDAVGRRRAEPVGQAVEGHLFGRDPILVAQVREQREKAVLLQAGQIGILGLEHLERIAGVRALLVHIGLALPRPLGQRSGAGAHARDNEQNGQQAGFSQAYHLLSI